MIALRNDNKAVSPIIAVILMVSLVVVLAGVVAIWTFTFIDDTEDADPFRLLDVKLDGAEDDIHISITNGKPMEIRFMKVNIEGTMIDLSSVSITELSVGENLILDSPIDLVEKEEYNIKISYRDNVIANLDVEVPLYF